MAILSKSCVYGLRAILYISASSDENEEETFHSIRVISETLDISFHFLTKILQTLTAAGLLQSYRGPKGGVRLARPETDITLLDVLEAIDGEALLTSCILGLPGCGTDCPCPLHEQWIVERERIRGIFAHTTLSEIKPGVRNAAFRINEEGHISFPGMGPKKEEE